MTTSRLAAGGKRVNSKAELMERQFRCLAEVAGVLSEARTIEETLTGILGILHNHCGLQHGVVNLYDPENSTLQVGAVYRENDGGGKTPSVKYQPGEGIVGRVLSSNQSIVLGRISSEPRFLDRLELYDLELPFIGVPIRDGKGKAIGVLAAQPDVPADDYLAERTEFMTAAANLLSQTVRLLVNQEEGQTIARERDELRREVRVKYGFDNMVVGHSDGMRRVFDQVRRVAKWDSTVLILGESGTGKELIANAIHYNSPRAHNHFVCLNCASLPENLLESELFGHEKGAFTNAIKQRKGRFEQADGGTLFLDEIGEISALFQAKLLRVLQEGELERVGGGQTIKVNVRIVAATNRNLEEEVEKGRFREDLYYRLNVMAIQLPPLRERLVDVPELATFLLDKVSRQQGRPLRLTDNAIRILMSHDWPGNVRQLENCLERAAVMSEEGVIDSDVIALPDHQRQGSVSTGNGSTGYSSPAPATASSVDLDNPEMDERERLIAALEQTGWVQAKAARLLNMTPRQIAYRIQTMKINVRKL
ncbi:nif-specific transcriptional activator NifA [Candidatus Thalassolituus haligoni]|uniref:nif-specific transcriptional activator NifA n=1 Tax=Candidatus Thalassolituus haligoni TaxID=3100113 RepID=UPI003512C1E7|tara:strand:+ start:16613 stop:18220 length:1608 start_codon:yes stop_codon:yes gene_type:complete